MTHNEQLTQRIRRALAHLDTVEEKKMFRGITFMINGNMCFSTGDRKLLCRIDPAIHAELLETKACDTMRMKGREYRGWVYVDENELRTKKDLDFWIKLVLDYTKTLKPARKK